MSKIKVILTDFDGVLRNFPETHSGDVEKALGLQTGALLPIALQRQYLEPAITGKISDEEWRKQVAAELAQRFETAAVEAAIKTWTAFPGKVDQEVHSFYRSKKIDYKIALLTNATSKLNSDLLALGLSDLFDFVYNTSEIGYAKPDPRAFEHVLNTIGHSASEILFIDDRTENIEMAKALGFSVHLFENFYSLKMATD